MLFSLSNALYTYPTVPIPVGTYIFTSWHEQWPIGKTFHYNVGTLKDILVKKKCENAEYFCTYQSTDFCGFHIGT